MLDMIKKIIRYIKNGGMPMIVLIALGVLFIAGAMLSLLIVITVITTDEERTIYLVSDSSTGTGRVIYSADMEGTYYESLQDSMEAYWKMKDFTDPLPIEEDNIITFGDNYLLFVYTEELYLLGPAVQCVLVECKNGLYSCPKYCWSHPIMKTYFQKEISSEEDKAAFSLITSYFHREATMQANGGLPIFYGVGIEEKVKQLSILGREPDEVFSYMYDGDTYYFWYYLDGSEFVEYFDRYPDLEQMTAEDAVGYFKIKFD